MRKVSNVSSCSFLESIKKCVTGERDEITDCWTFRALTLMISISISSIFYIIRSGKNEIKMNKKMKSAIHIANKTAIQVENTSLKGWIFGA